MASAPAFPPRVVDAALGLIRARRDRRPLVLGICGAQGSGKTTLAATLLSALTEAGVSAATLSLDDLYLTRAERGGLAQRIHPLLATRGVPGTHDVALGLAVFDRLAAGDRVAVPRFDKAVDDRAPPERWPMAPAGCEVILFEGWCVGARPQGEVDLLEPVNALERDEDPDGLWRRHVNRCLAGEYQTLFARLDALVLLAAPSFDVVARWRLQQEAELGPGPAVMDAPAVARFVRHYERLTRHILAEMPARADLVVKLDAVRCVTEILSKG